MTEGNSCEEENNNLDKLYAFPIQYNNGILSHQ